MHPKSGIIAACLVAAWSLGALAAPPSRIVPPEALALIKKVNVAAIARDYAALHQLMVADFVWSFGGDRDSAQAIDAWRNDLNYLAQLRRVTALKCAFREDGYVECPAKAGRGFRAGFKVYADGWRLAYFVAGD